MNNTFSSSLDFSEFLAGLRIFVKLTGLKEDPLEHRWVRDEFDLITALSYIPYFVKNTVRFTAERMYAKYPYNYIQDAKQDLQECLLKAKEPKDSAILRKKHLMMYHLTVVPAINVLQQLPTKQECVSQVDEIINVLSELVLSHEIYTSYEDALVAKAQVKRLIEERTIAEATRKKSRPLKQAKPDTVLIPPTE